MKEFYMKRIFIIALLLILSSLALAQKPGQDYLLWWLNGDSLLTLNGTVRDSLKFDFRPRGYASSKTSAIFTGAFDLWFRADSLDGNTDLTLSYAVLDSGLSSGIHKRYDYLPVFNYRMAVNRFNFDDDQLYGPIKCYCDEGYGIMIVGSNGSVGDTSTVQVFLSAGNQLINNSSPYKDAIRYLNDYTNSTLMLIGSTDTLTIPVYLGNTEGFTGIQFTPLAYTDVDSFYMTITPYTWWGELATNRAFTAFSQYDIAGASVDTSITIIPCNKFLVSMWLTDCTNDTLTFDNNKIGVRFKMCEGK